MPRAFHTNLNDAEYIEHLEGFIERLYERIDKLEADLRDEVNKHFKSSQDHAANMLNAVLAGHAAGVGIDTEEGKAATKFVQDNTPG